MKKPTKKEWYIIAGSIVVLILLWLYRRHSSSSIVTNGAGQPAATNYMTYNIPPINGDGFTQPTFGNTYYPGINLGGSGCNSCSQPKYYASNQDLANAMGNTGADAVQAALQSLPNYMTVNVDQAYTSGQLQDAVNYQVLSSLPVLALGGSPDVGNQYAPAGITAQ